MREEEGPVCLSLEKKNCFAERETEEKSVGFRPRRIVTWEVIVRSRAWMRRTVEVRVVA